MRTRSGLSIISGLAAHPFIVVALVGLTILVCVCIYIVFPGAPVDTNDTSAEPGLMVDTGIATRVDPLSWSATTSANVSVPNPTLKPPSWTREDDWEDLFEGIGEEASSNQEVSIRTVTIRRNGTLGQALNDSGVTPSEAQVAIDALAAIVDPRRLKAGQQVILTFSRAVSSEKQNDHHELTNVELPLDVDRRVVAERTEGGKFLAEEVRLELRREATRANGKIEGSLFLAASRAGLSTPIIMEMVRLFSWDVDFQRDIQPGDDFEVLFETYFDTTDRPVKTGSVSYASLTLSGTKLSLYRHELADGRTNYFDNKGRSVKKALLRTPINGARLSSHYGKRKDPILGYTKMHRGVDFAAPRGTPILAAGDGVVEWMGRNGAYGKYIRIRHNNRYKTAYAHMKAFAKGVQGGKRVRQGQTIGYVGSTGRSTGPHLHYELLVHNKRTNPMKVKLPSGEALTDRELSRFIDTQREIHHALLRAPNTSTLTGSQ